MSAETLLKGFFVLIYSGIFAWVVFSRFDSEIGEESGDSDHQKHQPYLPAMLLPVSLVVIIAIAIPVMGWKETIQAVFSSYICIFLHISLYYLVLMLLLPLLRRRISSRACAMLWIIPNYLYITQQSAMQVSRPRFVIRVPGNGIWIILGIWLVGFILVLGWKILQHLLFRRRILRDARPVMDPETLALWTEALDEAWVKKRKFKLVISPAVSTPLSIGFFNRSIRVVLPDQIYSPSELKLIFRHEIIHICREDSSNKFFLVFCTAMCWFNPLMWIAMRRSADDLELSCDETALLDADEETRLKYANLLLRTAGDEKGFTTCLSATASALRYRLKRVMSPGKVTSGALIVGLAFFVLCMTCGYVALAYGGSTGAEVIYQSQDTSLYSVRHITADDDGYNTVYGFPDEAALHEYLAGLTMTRITGNFSFSEYERKYTFIFYTPQGTLGVYLTDHAIRLTPLYGGDRESTTYYLPEGIDWAYFDTLISPARP